jgi:imidazolonepropionase-like amidohydrolase
VEAKRFINDRVSEDADYIKVIADVPGPDQPTLNALVAAAHDNGKSVVAHATILKAYEMAQEAKVDTITHAPLYKLIDSGFAKRIVAERHITIPTLTMMKGMTENRKSLTTDFNNAKTSVTVMYQEGVPILAGTDANDTPAAPAMVAHGASIHEELELLVDAGQSTVRCLADRHFIAC